MLKRIEIVNFRNHLHLEVEPGRKLLVLGGNAAGKSNFLEAIEFLSRGKTSRAQKEKEVIGWGKDFTRIVGFKEDSTKIEVAISPEKKVIKVNQKPIFLAKLIGTFKTISFSPDDLALIFGPPEGRRRNFDFFIAQTDHHYLLDLIQYRGVLQRRNRALFYKQLEGMEFWDEKLVALGTKIVAKREEVSSEVEERVEEFYRFFGEESLLFKYQPKTQNTSLREALRASFARDLKEKTTTFGPHRDDWEFILKEKPLKYFGSRGEGRSAALALKIAEAALIRAKTGDFPTILLDDIFSELDPGRREKVLELTKDYQIIITTADEGEIPKNAKFDQLVKLD